MIKAEARRRRTTAQAALERVFTGGAVLFGGVFIAAGLGVSIEAICKVRARSRTGPVLSGWIYDLTASLAICKVTDNALPVEVDELLVQYVEPALTPRCPPPRARAWHLE